MRQIVIVVIKKIIQSLFVFLIAALITFYAMNWIPGGPFNREKAVNKEVVVQLQEKYQLDMPIYKQFINYMKRLVIEGDLGPSLKFRGRDVGTVILEKFPISFTIGIIALSFAVVFGILLGFILDYIKKKKNGLIDLILYVLITIPSFVYGIVYIVVCGTFGFNVIFENNLRNIIIASCIISIYPICYIAQLVKIQIEQSKNRLFFRALVLKGYTTRRIYVKHLLKNAMIPVVSYMGPLSAIILTGSGVIEQLLNIPGLGKFFYESIAARDYTMIMGTTLFYCLIIVIANLIAELFLIYLNPALLHNNEN